MMYLASVISNRVAHVVVDNLVGQPPGWPVLTPMVLQVVLTAAAVWLALETRWLRKSDQARTMQLDLDRRLAEVGRIWNDLQSRQAIGMISNLQPGCDPTIINSFVLQQPPEKRGGDTVGVVYRTFEDIGFLTKDKQSVGQLNPSIRAACIRCWDILRKYTDANRKSDPFFATTFERLRQLSILKYD